MKNWLKRTIAIGAAVSMAALSACSVTTGTPGGDGTTAGGDGGNGSSEDGFRVAYVARAQVDSFAAWLANEMKAEAENFDDITLDVFDGQADDEVENRMIENAIANQYDAIIIQANNAEAQRPYIEQSVAAGIVTITTNPRVEGIEGASSIDANPFEQGGVVARLALEMIPENAKVVVLNGPAGNMHSTERRRAWEEEFFAKRSDVQIVGEDIANWNKDEAMTLMEDWSLAHPDIQAIISMNDNMATGGLEAVKGKAGFEEIQSYGVDGTAEAVLLIEAGDMTATSLQDARELAQLNMQTVHDLLTGVEEQVDSDVGNPLITIDNASEFVEMYRETGQIS